MAQLTGNMSTRFADIGPTDLAEIEDARLSRQTLYNDKYVENLLLKYCEMKNVQLTSTKQDLDETISAFIASVRTKTGDFYSAGALANIYHSIARICLKKCGFDIRVETEFVKSARMLKNMKAILKKRGKGVIQHTDVISDEDLTLLGDMRSDTPVFLQMKAWILIQLHYARRGNENGHEMKKSDLIFKNCGTQEYMELKDSLTKNHRESDTSSSYGGVLFSIDDDSRCPIKIMKKYLSKLHPNNPYLWQRPKQTYCDEESTWYCDMKIGVNKWKSFMPEIANILKLSKRYTNHSLRATAITILGTTFEDTDVQTVSGHKSTSCLAIYKRTSLSKKQKMSQTLQNSLYECTERTVEKAPSPLQSVKDSVENAKRTMNIVENQYHNMSALENEFSDGNHFVENPLLVGGSATNHMQVMLSHINEPKQSCTVDVPITTETEVASKKQCFTLDGSTFSFSGNNSCTINFHFNNPK